jgi:arylsulfatase A-like enzyme
MAAEHAADAWPARPSTVARGAGVGMTTGAVLGALVSAELFVRVRFASSSDALRLGAALFPTLLLSGAVCGVAAVLVRRLTARRGGWLRRVPEAVLLAAVLSAVGIGVWVSWLATAFRTLSAIQRIAGVGALFVLIGVALVVVGALTESLPKLRTRRARTFVVAGATVATALLLAWDRWLPAALYPEFHELLGIHAAMACAVAVSGFARRFRVPFANERLAALGAAGAFAAFVLVEALEVRPPAATDALVYGRLVRSLRRASDFDGDGASSWFGGRDCRPFDRAFAPGRTDVPENGVDEDCSGRDARRLVSPARAAYTAPDARGFNLVWLSIDALRADHVGSYGYSRKTTPAIDRLAASSIRFERAYAQSTGTWDSVPSMLSGRYPHALERDYEHPRALLGKRWYSYFLKPDMPLIGDVLRQAGYSTAGFASDRVFLWLGFDGRFERWERTTEHRRAGLAVVENAREPFFLWQHLPFPHEPYVEQPRFRFGPNALDRYDSEIAFSDSIVGDIIAALERRGVLGRTVVVVTADHGEAFGEHGNRFHGRSCYDEQTHVPLVLWIPGVNAGIVSVPVELVDLVPTLLELLRVSRDALELDGESLLGALLAPAAFGARGAYCEYYRNGPTLKSLILGRHKLVVDLDLDRVELFDLARDPRELVNVEHHEPDARERLFDALSGHPSRTR